jgi:hypothetical protein
MKPRRAEVAGWTSLSINMIERSAESRLEDVRASGQASESGLGLRSHRPTRRSCARRAVERWAWPCCQTVRVSTARFRAGYAAIARNSETNKSSCKKCLAFILPSLLMPCCCLCDVLARHQRFVDEKMRDE